MSEDNTGESNANEASENQAASGGDGQGKPPFIIFHQYVKDLSFENPNGLVMYSQEGFDPKQTVQMDVTVQQLQERDFEVSLHINAHSVNKEKTAYLAEIVYGAAVRVGDIPANALQPLLFVEIPRQIFPFARAVLANAIRDGGYQLLVLNPIDFGELLRHKMEAAARQQQEAGEVGAAEGKANGGNGADA